MIFITGSGFGLYGHLPALIHMGRQVATLAHYRPKLLARRELAEFDKDVIWVDNVREGAARADAICLARRPEDNLADALDLLEYGTTANHLIMEKPLAPTPAAAQLLLDAVGQMPQISLSVPYLFLHTDWFAGMIEAVATGRRTKVEWQHQVSPSTGGWKMNANAGGGAVSFYSIHSLALLEALYPGALDQQSSETTDDGVLVRQGKTEVRLRLGEVSRFRVMNGGRAGFDAASPFGAAGQFGVLDPRLLPLRRFHAGVGAQDLHFHAAVVARWELLLRAAHA